MSKAPLALALAKLSDRELAEMREARLAKLTPRARIAAIAMVGNSAKEASKRAGLSTCPSAVSRLQDRVEGVVAILREEARRTSTLTLEAAVTRFRALSEEAREAKDYGAATRALAEACKLLALYPDARLQVEHNVNLGEVTAAEWEQLSRLRHEVRQLPAARTVVEVQAAPEPAESHLSQSPAAPGALQASVNTGESTSSKRNEP
jgi:hypothetical protein